MSEYEQVIDEIVKHGVVVKINKVVDDNYIPCERKYVGCVVELDFTEHDKGFKDEIKQLKNELEEINCNFSEYKRHAQDRIAEIESELEAKDVDDRTVELPFDALETANMLINAEYSRQTSSAEKAFTGCNVAKGHIYSVDDLEQIAEHLLVYCKHNREEYD